MSALTPHSSLLTPHCFLGIDFGTSGARAIVIDGSGAITCEARLPFRDQSADIWRSALFELIAQIPRPLRQAIRAIAINGTSATVLLCDANHRPLFPPLLYNDSRAHDEAARLEAIAPADSPVLSASSSLAKLLWLARQPGCDKGHFLQHQADWLAAQLHGRPGLSDYHNTLKLGYDPATLSYPAWLQALEIAPLLPQVMVPGSTIGPILPEIAQRFGLPADCQVRAGTTDSIAAFLASGANRPGQAVTSLGSTLVLKLLSEKRVDAAEYGIYSHRLGRLWLAGGASNSGGGVLRQYFSEDQLIALSAQIDPDRDCGLDYYPLPSPGERFPVNDPSLEPRLTPRPADDTVFLQGLLEGMARIEARGYQLLQELGATPLESVLTAGGGAANASWMAIRRRILGVPVQASPHTEAAYGTALLAARGESLLCWRENSTETLHGPNF